MAVAPAQSERALLERLPQLVEDIPAEFPEFIQKEHAAVGEGQFPRSRCAAAPQKGGAGAAVVRAAEGARADQSALLLQFSGHGIELGDLQLLRGLRGGSRPARLWASRVLPLPGGPTSRR